MKLRNIILLSLLIILVSCDNHIAKEPNDHLVIYTSIYPIQFLTEELAGDEATVKSIYPPGVDAHSYEPSTREMIKIAEADAFFYFGEHMESFSETIAKAIESEGLVFLELSSKNDSLLHKEEGHDHADPHVWLDPLRMIQMAETIRDELISLSPGQKDMYEQNFKKLKEKLLELDQMFVETLSEKKQREIIVSVGAYEYWHVRYGIEQFPINGVTEGYEPSQKELIEIVELAKDKKIKHVMFAKNNVDRISKIIQDHLKASALYLHDLETLSEEDLSKNENYITLMKKNLKALDKALN